MYLSLSLLLFLSFSDDTFSSPPPPPFSRNRCIMQWYQRNSTCPMCFRQVELECESSQQLMVEATRPFIRM